MKTLQNILKKTFLVCSLFFFMNTFAQAPNLMSYQAVVRDGSNALIANTAVGIKISILQTTATGTVVFAETQTVTTNTNGLATLQIGAGTPVIGTIGAIDWSTGPYFIKTETDPTGGTSYTITSTSQLMSVPYALFAANSGSATATGTINYVSKFATSSTLGNSQIFDDGNAVGINNPTPNSKLYVNGQGAVDTPLGDIQYTGGTNNVTRVGTITNNNIISTSTNVGTYSNAGNAKNNVAFYGTTTQSTDTTASYTALLLDNFDNHLITDGAVTGIFSDVGNDGSGRANGIKSFVNQTGATQTATGIYNNVSGAGKTTGLDMITQTAGNSDINGINNITASGGTGFTNGAVNIGDGFGITAGTVNLGYGENSAVVDGAYNEADGYGTGTAYGSENVAISYGGGDAYGANINATGSSNAKTIGANVVTSGVNNVPLTTVGVKVVNNNNDHVTTVTSNFDVANPAGYFTATGGSGQGVYGESVGKGFSNGSDQYGIGVTGVSRDASGANGYNFGVLGVAANSGISNIGVAGFTDLSSTSTGFETAIYGEDQLHNANSLAGYFSGNVFVDGSFTSTGPKPFTIDNPMDPENKLLRHFAVEGPEVLNNYSGNITTDASGKATVQLPEYFESINKDYRYQLTAIGTFAQAIVSKEIANNQFEISTSVPNVKVSWQVMGVRNDAYMQKVNTMQAVEDKPAFMKGKYLTPAAYDKPKLMGAFYIPTGKNGVAKNTVVEDAIQQSEQKVEASKAMRLKVKTQIAAAKKEIDSKNKAKTTKK